MQQPWTCPCINSIHVGAWSCNRIWMMQQAVACKIHSYQPTMTYDVMLYFHAGNANYNVLNRWFLVNAQYRSPNKLHLYIAQAKSFPLVYWATLKHLAIILQFTIIMLPYGSTLLKIQWGDLNPHLTRGSSCSPESAPQTASRSVQPFLQGSRTLPTHRHTYTQTDRPRYSVCSNRLLLLAAMRPNNSEVIVHGAVIIIIAKKANIRICEYVHSLLETIL